MTNVQGKRNLGEKICNQVRILQDIVLQDTRSVLQSTILMLSLVLSVFRVERVRDKTGKFVEVT